MTNRPPSDPESSQKTALGFDEFIGIFVAFTTIGGILFWSFSRKDNGLNFNGLLSPFPTPSSSVQPNNLPSPSLTPQLEPNKDSNFNTLPSSPNVDVVEPSITPAPIAPVTPSPRLPFTKVAPIESTRTQEPVSLAKSFESSIKSSPLPLVSPAEQKSTIPPPIAFNDVSTDFWAGRFINVLSSRGIIKGFPDYSFRPNQPVNRAEFAAILQQAFEKEGIDSTISFKDVSANSWATPAINEAIRSGFLKGYPNKIFKPEQKISRVQVLVALVSGLNLKEPAAPSQVLSIYKDAQDIPKYATGKIATATANGLVINYPNPKVFAPNKEATRAEVAAMVHQALVQTGRVDRISSENIVQLPE
ncbi:S-layer homology domain-containing protein [Dendronalium sp. ChiSLP03b]|uniref:S-layer homology domain-containing protein n=1 Tax=Dendronalium sp. ChiSLP03b TaxID=3075381 RepID=UPI002AD56C2B|nr:S-layer homology domain-containing protein [Dendronalium sp. ChiSLP03b]MDZ8207119.1 S-layer homology domain-containing protein [Dendronalium sp. ChiSLP03b]